jgi:undecaprenyl-diphosphatase
MTGFDAFFYDLLAPFAHQNQGFDLLVNRLADNAEVKTLPTILLVWWFWFQAHKNQRIRREWLISTLGGGFVAMVIGRILIHVLPFRDRPVWDPAWSSAVFPFHAWMPDHFSSFPSDHAVLFFALATGLWLVSRPAGLIATLWAVVMVCLPRVYLGYHFATDILVGAACGAAVALVTAVISRRIGLLKLIVDWSERSPAVFYVLMFFVSFQVADMFEDIRAIVSLVGIN